jgi:hypothetical protein
VRAGLSQAQLAIAEDFYRELRSIDWQRQLRREGFEAALDARDFDNLSEKRWSPEVFKAAIDYWATDLRPSARVGIAFDLSGSMRDNAVDLDATVAALDAAISSTDTVAVAGFPSVNPPNDFDVFSGRRSDRSRVDVASEAGVRCPPQRPRVARQPGQPGIRRTRSQREPRW